MHWFDIHRETARNAVSTGGRRFDIQVDVGIYTAREGVLELLGGVVGLYRFRLYDDCGIASLHILALRGDGSCHVAGCQSEGYCQAGQQGCHSRSCDFVDLLLGHDDN